MSEKAIIIGVVILTVFIIGGGIFFLSNSPTKAVLQKTVGARIETPQTSFDFKNVPYNGGFAKHSFTIKNIGDKELQIANLATSCTCTKVFYKKGKEESPYFSMKGHSGESSWTGVLKPKEKAELVIVFDPTAHGPQGVGPIERIISFETNDPDKPYVEFSFKGVVVR